MESHIRRTSGAAALDQTRCRIVQDDQGSVRFSTLLNEVCSPECHTIDAAVEDLHGNSVMFRVDGEESVAAESPNPKGSPKG
jgi:hypothetical protein